MRRAVHRTMAWSAALLLAAAAASAEPATWVALSWHDVRDAVDDEADRDQFAVSVRRLVEQFEWLKGNGWQPVSIEQIVAAHAGGDPLPERAVLLSFDDGLASLYTHVYPLLRAYGWPAVAAVVTSWLDEVERGERIDYEGRARGREDLVTWEQLAEMADSGLVELASHSHDMHRGVLANPFGNEQPAATTLEYLPDQQRYESETEYAARVRADLARSVHLIEQRTGRRPRTIVWPYGEYNDLTEAIAAELGMAVSLGLTTGVNDVESLSGNHRFLVSGNPDLGWFAENLPQVPSGRALRRVAHVDLDYLHDSDPAQQARNLDSLLDRIRALSITTVYLQAFADPDGDGTADALYFPNRHLPMRADLFNRVAWQLRTRAEVEVYAWLPVMAYDLPDEAAARSLAVHRHDPEGPTPARRDYRRLSPFLPEARRIIGEIYQDLARHAHVAGILFHDDAYLAADEDAAACFADATWPNGGPMPADCRLTPRQKTEALIAFTDGLAAQVRRYRPAVRTARNLYARVVLEPDAEARFSQTLGRFLDAYDHTALMAMPYLEDAEDAVPWLLELLDEVARHPRGLERTIFELQAKDWREDRWLDGAELREQMLSLIRAGALHIGYYPDDFVSGLPELEPLFQGLSLRTFPYRETSR